MSGKSVGIIVLLCFYGFGLKAQNSNVYISKNIESLWETSPELKVPESVYYCKKLNTLFVSNINGNPAEKDGNGFISTLTTDGKIISLEWVNGLNAPKGIGIYKERLFVTDIDRIAEIDIKTKQIIRFYDVPDSKFLNDITIDAYGSIYISDTQTNVIYRLYNGVVKKWFSSDLVVGPNGLCVLNDFLFIGTKGKIVKVNLKTKTPSDYILNTGSIDGLICFGKNQFVYSDWSGNVYITSLGKETEKLLDTTPQKINAADFGFDYARKIIFVPTFYDNRIMAYKINF